MDPLVAILFVIGLVLLIAGGEALVRGAGGLAVSVGVSPIVVGLTVVAFGTSSPEFAVSIGSAIAGEPDIVVGNVVGSNIYNVLLILGLSATIVPLIVGRELVRRDVPLMVLASLGVILFALDGSIGRVDGIVLVAALVAWTGWTVRAGRTGPGSATEDAMEEIGVAPGGSRLRQLGLIVAGLVLLVVGARWLVDGAVSVATTLGLSPLVIGLTIVAFGTSLPELATSVIASLRGQRDLAVGNVVGSNLFNLLGVLGLTAVIAGEVPVAPGALSFDMPVMLAVAIACLPIFFTGFRIARSEGVLFLAYGVGYTVYLLATALQHAEVRAFTEALAFVLVPLTAVTLLVLVARQLRSHRHAPM